MTRLAIAPVGIALSALGLGTIAQIIGMAVILVGIVAVGSSRQKDAAIKDYESALEGCRARADSEHTARIEAERRVSELAGKIETLERYAAPEAFKEIATKLGSIEALIQAWIATRGLDN